MTQHTPNTAFLSQYSRVYSFDEYLLSILYHDDNALDFHSGFLPYYISILPPVAALSPSTSHCVWSLPLLLCSPKHHVYSKLLHDESAHRRLTVVERMTKNHLQLSSGHHFFFKDPLPSPSPEVSHRPFSFSRSA